MAVCARQRYSLSSSHPILSPLCPKDHPLSLRLYSWGGWSLNRWNTREVLVLQCCWWVLFYFLPWPCPGLLLPSYVYLPSILQRSATHPPLCRYSPSIIDLFFWDSASPLPMTGILSQCSGPSTPFGQCRAFPRAHGNRPVGPPGQPSACEPAPELCQTHITGDPQEDVGWELLRNCQTLSHRASIVKEACQRSSGCLPHSVPWCKCDPKGGSPVSGVGSLWHMWLMW